MLPRRAAMRPRRAAARPRTVETARTAARTGSRVDTRSETRAPARRGVRLRHPAAARRRSRSWAARRVRPAVSAQPGKSRPPRKSVLVLVVWPLGHQVVAERMGRWWPARRFRPPGSARPGKSLPLRKSLLVLVGWRRQVAAVRMRRWRVVGWVRLEGWVPPGMSRRLWKPLLVEAWARRLSPRGGRAAPRQAPLPCWACGLAPAQLVSGRPSGPFLREAGGGRTTLSGIAPGRRPQLRKYPRKRDIPGTMPEGATTRGRGHGRVNHQRPTASR